MFYRKYRPQKFSDLIGIDTIKSTIQKQVIDNKFAHAYLFIGPRGTGKTTLARIFAKSINCKKLGKSGEPCDKCEICLGVNDGSLIDLVEIDAASNRGVDDIRGLRDGVKLAPSVASYKVYIIDEVHMLTNEAFNALLKTLEEPPSHSIFVLATTDSHKIPETVRSRCQVYELNRAKVGDLVKVLEYIIKQEKTDIKQADLKRIAVAAKGGFRDAVTMLEQLITSGLGVDNIINSSNEQDFAKFMQSLVEGDSAYAINLINSLYERGVDLEVFTEGFVLYVRDILLVQVGEDDLVKDETPENLNTLKEFANKLTQNHIIKLISVFTSAQGDFRNAVTSQLPLEVAVLTLLSSKSEEKNSSVNLKVAGGEVKKKSEVGSSDQQVNTQRGHNGSSEVKERDPSLDNADPEQRKTVQAGQGGENKDRSGGDLTEVWLDVVNAVSSVNSSLSAILKNAKPVKTEGGTLILEVYYSFHKERIEATRNKEMLADVLENAIGVKKIECIVGVKKAQKKLSKEGLVNIKGADKQTVEGDMTDKNVTSVEIDIDDLAKLLEE